MSKSNTSSGDKANASSSSRILPNLSSSKQIIKSPSQTDDEADRDSGICSLYCLARCLSGVTPSKMISNCKNDEEITSNLLKTSSNIKPFLKASLFSNVPPTIKFYLKGNKVKKPPAKHSVKLTWCQNSLLPLVIRQSLGASHFKVVDENKQWIGYWGRHLKSAQYKNLRMHQKVNHFAGEFHIGRKDRLWQHIYEMMKRFDNGQWCIMPFTYILPKDSRKLRAYLSVPFVRHIILKPPASARGTGISIISKYSEVPTKTPLIAQHYIESPLTINNSKFDLRIYVYVPSLDPLRVYVYDEGLVRFASVAYEPSSHASYSNQFMHLTNYSINKAYSVNAKEGETAKSAQAMKWKLSEFWTYLRELGHDADALKISIEGIATKALIASESGIREHAVNHCAYPFISHELFGMDILVDSDLHPWLMEMNISPALLSPSPVDVAVKSVLAVDVLNIIDEDNDIESFKSSLYYQTRNFAPHKTSAHLTKEESHLKYFERNKVIHPTILDELTDADVRILVEFEDELTRRGALKLVFPTGLDTLDYLQCINSPLYSNYLLAQWQISQAEDRRPGIERLEALCARGHHVASPTSSSSSSGSSSSADDSDSAPSSSRIASSSETTTVLESSSTEATAAEESSPTAVSEECSAAVVGKTEEDSEEEKCNSGDTRMDAASSQRTQRTATGRKRKRRRK